MPSDDHLPTDTPIVGPPAVLSDAVPPMAAPVVSSYAEPSVHPEPTPDPVFPRGELLAAAASFGVHPWDIGTALHLLGKDQATRAEIEDALARVEQRDI